MPNTKQQKETFKVTTYAEKDIDKHIVDVGGKAKSLKVKIHSLAVSIMKVWHDNPSKGQWAAERINNLQAASPYHTKAFSKWVSFIFTTADGKAETIPFIWNDETKVWVVKKDAKIMGKLFMALRDNPFWEVSPAPAPQPFVLSTELQKILDKAEKRMDTPVEGDEIDVSALKHIRQALSTLVAKEVEGTR